MLDIISFIEGISLTAANKKIVIIKIIFSKSIEK